MAIVDGYWTHPQVRAQMGLSPLYESSYEGGGLGGVEDDVKRILSLIPGASGYYNSLIALIQQKAKEGALQAVPEIKAQVEATVKPYVYTAFLLGLGGFLFGISTYLQNRRTA